MAKFESDEILLMLKSLSDKADKTTDAVNRLDKTLDLHIQKTEFRFEAIAQLDEEQNDLLAKHAQRSEEIKRDNELREKELRAIILGEGHKRPERSLKGRVEALEMPHKWWKFTAKMIGSLGAIGGITAAIKHLMSLLGK